VVLLFLIGVLRRAV